MGEETKQDITSVIKEGAKVTQIGKVEKKEEKKEIHLHIYQTSPEKGEKIEKKVYLIYIDRDGEERVLELRNKIEIYRDSKGWDTFVRGDENKNLNVMDGSISRNKHAIFYIEKDEIYVEDLGSKNGTFINGKRIKKEKVVEGDLVGIGPNLIFRVEYNPNKITAKKFHPIPLSKDMIKKIPSKNVVETEKGYFFIPSSVDKGEIDNKIFEIKETDKKESIENLKRLIVDDNPSELIKKLVDLMFKEIGGEEFQALENFKEKYEKKDTRKDVIKMLEEIIEDL